MPQIHTNAALMCPAPGPVLKPAPVRTEAKQSPEAAKGESQGDHLLRMVNYSVGGAGTVAGLVAVPQQIVKTAPTIMHTATAISLKAAAYSATQSGILARLSTGLALSAGKLSQATSSASQVANATMRSKIFGRVFSPKVADMMTTKVLPTANAVGAGISILDNGNRFYKAHQKGNTAGQVVAGIQIGLQATSAVTGYLPGKAQWIFAGTGLASLGLELAHQFGGVGK